MDAFFVEVERLADPALRGVPVVVGGGGRRGVVASASYEARRYGVHSALPTAVAQRRCPGLRVVPPDHRAYAAASHRVFEVLGSFTPLVEGVSVDEAFLDISGLRLHFSSPRAVAESLLHAIRAETGLPASVGVATVKLIAKMAADDAKPEGILVVPAGSETSYLHPKPVRALWGVGEATHARLEQIGAVAIGDLAALPLESLVGSLGSALGHHLAALARGCDPRPVVPGGEPSSVSVEQTYEEDLAGAERLERELLVLSDRLARRLRRAGSAARTVSLKVRFADFSTITRTHSAAEPTDSARDLFVAARALLDRAGAAGRPVRLLGLGATRLTPESDPRQLGLAGPDWSAVSATVDEIRQRFGEDAVGPARLAPPAGAGGG